MKLPSIIPNLTPSKSRLLESGLIWMVAFLMLIGAAVYIPAVVYVSSTVEGRAQPIFSIETDQKEVALSFDVTWENEDTLEILNILAEHDIHATFFMTGAWVQAFPDEVKAIAAAGHDLGNHSENHKGMSSLDASQIEEEIMPVHARVKDLTGIEMELFRPPYGEFSSQLITTAEDCGYETIQWDVDSLDWKDYGTEAITQNVIQNQHLGNGSIILLHNGAKYTKDALESIIEGLESQGYSIVPVSELIE